MLGDARALATPADGEAAGQAYARACQLGMYEACGRAAAFVGAGIAKANPLKTGIEATKLAIAAFLVPYVFVYNPAMLMIDVTAVGIVTILATSVIGIIGVGAGICGYMVTDAKPAERALLVVGGALMVTPGWQTDIIGAVMLAMAYVLQRGRLARTRKAARALG